MFQQGLIEQARTGPDRVNVYAARIERLLQSLEQAGRSA